MHAPRERGAVAVEFALIVPLLVLFLLGIVEGGARYTQQSEINHWAFLVARDLSIDPSKNAQAIVDELSGQPGEFDATPETVSCADSTVTITVTAERESPSGMFGTYSLLGKGVARCES